MLGMALGFAGTAPVHAWDVTHYTTAEGREEVTVQDWWPYGQNQTNDMAIRVSGPVAIIQDKGAQIRSYGGDCSRPDHRTAICHGVTFYEAGPEPSTQTPRVVARLGAADDRLQIANVSDPFELHVDMEDGNDRFRAALKRMPLTVAGGAGDDVLDVRNFNTSDVVSCGPGTDTVYLDEGETAIDCEVQLFDPPLDPPYL
jgi:hypothetical protein